MKKRLLAILCAMMVLTMVVGCGNSNATASNTPASSTPANSGAASSAPAGFQFERKIEMVCPFGPGSGTDTTLRAFLPLMEKELGVSIVINNVEGASGVTGAEYFYKQPADGYTFAMHTPSHLIAAVNGTTSYDILNETVPVVRLVQDSNVILAGKNVPYNNLKELVEYAKANPGKAKIGMMSIAGIDAVAVQDLFSKAGIEVPMVPYSSGSEANAAVMGGHCDMVLTSPFDAVSYVESGDMKAIVVLSEKRSSVMPDTECTVELGYDATIGPWRGIVAKKGTPQEAIDAFEAAAVKVCQSPEWAAWKESVGLNDREGFANQEEFGKIWFDYYESMKEILKS